MSKTPRTNTIAPIGYARAQDLLLYREVWAGYSNKPADENGHPPVALYTQDQVNAMLAALRERADRNQEDAERYRWLRDTDIAVVAWIENDGPRWSIEGRDGHNITRDKLDAAIDAARGK